MKLIYTWDNMKSNWSPVCAVESESELIAVLAILRKRNPNTDYIVKG